MEANSTDAAANRAKDEEANRLDQWYAFEAESTKQALTNWCEANGIVIVDNDQPSA